MVGQANLFSTADPEVEQIVRQVRLRQAASAPADLKPAAPADSGGELIAVHSDRVAMAQVRSAGPVHVGFQFWKRLELEAILHRHGFSPRTIQLTCAMTLNRLIHPDSEHAMPKWIRSTALADILGVDFTTLADDPLYRNLDRLHRNRAAIESDLVERERRLFQLDPTVYLYDLTSTYFEGQATHNPKAQRGYSRDHRPDCKQVVVGLVIGREGFPLAHEVFAGNTQDRKTLGRILDLLKDRVGLAEGATVVVDRGMAYPENLREIRDRELHYVVAARQPERDEWLDDFEEEDGFEVMSASRRQGTSTRRSRWSGSRRSLAVRRRWCCAPAKVGRPRTRRFARSRRGGCWPTWSGCSADRRGPAQAGAQDRRSDRAVEATISAGSTVPHDRLRRHQREAGPPAGRREEGQGGAARRRLSAAE